MQNHPIDAEPIAHLAKSGGKESVVPGHIKEGITAQFREFYNVKFHSVLYSQCEPE